MTSLIRRGTGCRPIAVDEESRIGIAARAGAAGSPARCSASSASRLGSAVTRRRGGADVAGDACRGSGSAAPPTLARGKLQAVEQWRQVGADQVGPGRERADAPAGLRPRRCRASRAQPEMSRMSAWRMSPQPARAALAGYTSRAAGQHRHVLAGADRQGIFQRHGTVIAGIVSPRPTGDRVGSSDDPAQPCRPALGLRSA